MPDYDILSAAVTLLAGFLIFLTIGWRYPPVYAKLNKERREQRAYSRTGWLLLLTVLTAAISAGFSLLEVVDALSMFTHIKDIAVIFFIISLGFLCAFSCDILQKSPPSDKNGNNS